MLHNRKDMQAKWKKRKRKRTKSSKIGNIIFDNNYKSKNSEDSRVDKETLYKVLCLLGFGI